MNLRLVETANGTPDESELNIANGIGEGNSRSLQLEEEFLQPACGLNIGDSPGRDQLAVRTGNPKGAANAFNALAWAVSPNSRVAPGDEGQLGSLEQEAGHFRCG